jgi:hypothetical protein
MTQVDARNGTKFRRDECRTETEDAQKTPNFKYNTPEYFYQDDTGRLYNGTDNMTLTIKGCELFCGSWTFYWDAGPRVTTWIIPVLLLLSNIELSPIDKTRFMTIIHAIGDPIDSFWSLTHKVYIWHRLYAIGLQKSPGLPGEKINYAIRAFMAIRIALTRKKKKPKQNTKRLTKEERARVIATVLAGFEEIAGFGIESEEYYRMITQELGQLGTPNENPSIFEDWRRTARILADARTNEFSRTLLAILVYIFGLLAGFIPKIGGDNSTPPGGRIGSAIFLSWLVPLALLSNTIGTFTSRRTCLTIMRQFVWTVSQVDRRDSTWTSLSGKISFRPPGFPDDAQDGPLAVDSLHSTTGEITRPQKFIDRTRGSPSFSPTQEPSRNFIPDGTEMDTLIISKSAERVSTYPRRTSTDMPDRLLQAHSNEIEREPLVKPKSPKRVSISPRRDTTCVPDGNAQAKEIMVDIVRKDSWDEYWESLQWRGAIYTYRPWKVLYLDTDNRPRAHLNNFIMIAVASTPVGISAAGATIIIYNAVPPGFNCRHLWVIGITIAWIISAAVTSVIYAFYKTPTNGHRLWKIILYKDLFIGISSLLTILLSTVGAFNFCWCWSAKMDPQKPAYVPLNTDNEYRDKAKSVYSLVVGACIGAQLILYIAIMVAYRRGLKLVRWTEARRRVEWTHEMDDPPERTDDTFLLFWYRKNT